MAEITTICSEKLPMQLDSVSWNTKFDLLAVGAYMIDPDDSTKRIGKIFLIKFPPKFRNAEPETPTWAFQQEIVLSGVLDLRWEPQEQLELAVATSSSLNLYKLDHSFNELNLVGSLQLNAMALYAQWINTEKLVFSDSEGVVSIVSTSPLELQRSKKVHDNLTWVVQHCNDSDLIFAGSDEGKFTGFLLEHLEDDEKHYTKKFNVGVTSILFLNSNILAVGSYDDTLRLFTVDCVDPISLTLKKKIEFGGAVWRIQSLPSVLSPSAGQDGSFMIVAACARNGIHLVHLNSHDWTYRQVLRCLDHEGFLAYGLDAKLEDVQTYVIVSCYFDNQQLHIWKTKPDGFEESK